MFGAIANKHSLEAMVTPSVLEDMVWNLQTWPLDLVDWPTHNSHRLVRSPLAAPQPTAMPRLPLRPVLF